MNKYIELCKKFCLSPALPSSLLLAGNLFLYQPTFVFLGNQVFLNFKFSHYILTLLPFFLITILILNLPTIGHINRWRKIYTVLLVCVSLTCWLATHFKGTQGLLDGKSFLLITDYRNITLNCILLCSAGVLSGLLTWFYLKLVNQFIFLVNIMLILVVLWTGIFHNNSENDIKLLGGDATQEMLTFSKQKNVLVIILDTFQSDFFEELLIKNPELKEKLSGFTFFKEAVSVSPTTYLAIPTIHSGEVYQKGEVVSTFYKRALSNSFTQTYHRSGYRTFLANPYLVSPENITVTTQDQIVNSKLALLNEAALFIDLSIFRMVPHLLKASVYRNGQWLTSILLPRKPRAVISNEMVSYLAANLNNHSSRPTLKFIHSFASHPPAVLDSMGKQKELPWIRASAIDQDCYALTEVLKLIDALKRNQIYNSTAILIIGDHGAQLPPAGQSRIIFSGAPLFLFKSFNVHGDLKISEKVVSLIDIPKTLCTATNDCKNEHFPGEDVLAPATKSRKLKFNFYHWVGYYFHGGENNIIEFEISGPPRIASSWKRHFNPPLQQFTRLDFSAPNYFDYCGLGWEGAADGSHHRWTSGSLTELYLPSTLNKKMCLEFDVHTHAGNRKQKMHVYANGFFIGDYDISPIKLKSIKLDIPAKINNQSNLHLTFKFDQWNHESGPEGQDLAVDFEGDLKISS